MSPELRDAIAHRAQAMADTAMELGDDALEVEIISHLATAAALLAAGGMGRKDYLAACKGAWGLVKVHVVEDDTEEAGQ